MPTRTTDTFHAEYIVALVELACNKSMLVVTSDWTLALGAIAINVTLVTGKGDHMQLMAVLACVLLIFYSLELKSLFGDQ